MRRASRGFTLLELLVVVAIIGILAAIAIYNYTSALQRSKQKRTMADIRSVAIAWEARNTETRGYNSAGFSMPTSIITASGLATRLTPIYIRSMPTLDGWGRPIEFSLDSPLGASRPASTYAMRSSGRDGIYSGTTYTPGTTTDFDCDIVFSGGSFIVSP